MRVIFEAGREGFDAVLDALGVIEPVDADDHRAALEAGAHALHQHVAFGEAGFEREGLGVDADREGADLEFAAVRFAAPVRRRRGRRRRRSGRRGNYRRRVGMEADDVIGAEGAQQAVIERHRRGRIGGRPGDMVKIADAVLDPRAGAGNPPSE